MFAKNKLFVLAAMAAFALGVTACGDDDTTDYTPTPTATGDTGTPDAPTGDTGSPDANAGDAGNFDAGGDTTYDDYCELCLAEGLECFPPEEVETKASDDPQVVMVANWPCVDPVETETDPCDPYYEIEDYLWTCEGTTIEDEDYYVSVEDDHCALFDDGWEDGDDFGSDVIYHGNGEMSMRFSGENWKTCTGTPM